MHDIVWWDIHVVCGVEFTELQEKGNRKDYSCNSWKKAFQQNPLVENLGSLAKKIFDGMFIFLHKGLKQAVDW